ncbi:MAG: hypothetical protein ACOYN6_12080 [Ignavibacteria bacterium]
MKKLFLVLLLVMFILSIRNSYSQCSDAGICIIGDRHKKTKAEITSRTLSFQYSLGFSGHTTDESGISESMTFHAFKFGADYSLTDKFSLGLVLPVYSIVYNDNNTFNRNGLGDAFLIGNYITPAGKNQNVSFQGGFKLNTSSVDNEKFGYFNAQGSNDLIIGVDYNYSFLSFSGGAQIPLTNYKDDYGTTFKRGADVMVRAGLQRSAGDVKIKFELLAIKRLTESEFVYDGGPTSKVANSDFFQLNIMGGLQFNLSRDLLMDFGIALPMIERKEDTDGTKRVFTTNLGIRYNM